jgi:hypothetical protein
MDKIGYQLSYSQNELVIFDRYTEASLSLASDLTDWCSVFKSISAAKDAIKPLVIYKGAVPDKSLDRWFPSSPKCPYWR